MDATIGFTIALLFETAVLALSILLLRYENRRMAILIANYKSDLELVLLHSHNMDEFVRKIQDIMAGDDGADHNGYA
jgi:hypothetical protein